MTRRMPIAAFVGLAIATIAAFFIVQALKVTTPLIDGFPAPHPSRINPVAGGVCKLRGGGRTQHLVPTSFKTMNISFYLLKQADDVTVQIVDPQGHVVDTIARDRHMTPHHRVNYTWDGRDGGGTVVKPGRYYVQVHLIGQGRTVRISKTSTGVPEPVTVQTQPTPIRITAVRGDHAQTPAVMPQTSGRPVAIHFTVIGSVRPTVRIYRTDVPGKPQLVNSFRAASLHTAFWNGKTSRGTSAPQGTYLASVTGVDRTCTRSTFPTSLPPATGTTPLAGVTVRYLAAQPPTAPVAPGDTATVLVDSRRHAYTWSLRRVGSTGVTRSGHSSSVTLQMPMPGAADGLYVLSLSYGSHHTAVPLMTGAAPAHEGSGHGILVVAPELTWQGTNEVDDNDDGVPNTLSAGDSVRLARPFAHGLPRGFADVAGLLGYLDRAGLSYTLTTDLSMISGGESLLQAYSGVAFAGTERWLPAGTGSELSTYVERGGHVLSFGIGAFQRDVTVAGGQATHPAGPHAVDDLQARPGPVQSAHGSLLLVDSDHQNLFSSTAQAISGFRRFQVFGPVQAPAKLLSSAGVSPKTPSVIGYSLGKGAVVDVGLVGFGSALAHNVNAQELVSHAWRFLAR